MNQETESQYCKVHVPKMIRSCICVNRGQGREERTVSKKIEIASKSQRKWWGVWMVQRNRRAMQGSSQASWWGEEPQKVSTSHPRGWSGRSIYLANTMQSQVRPWEAPAAQKWKRSCWDDSLDRSRHVTCTDTARAESRETLQVQPTLPKHTHTLHPSIPTPNPCMWLAVCNIEGPERSSGTCPNFFYLFFPSM